ncbi:hypothetical protein PHYSODRAFT_261138 [Phytophthora sojae]|uniref:Uncharacterized protein n=1 Tax=Phytophthora sojae (strain P6497) TaxID=1094619 RepID=G4YL17_PHYSP|nr:hypothetical protein PHYSODRAFT_261138 [Phytophthora sojae]EGZ29772.1 hypothetical protein PHYSODRAFT_261138 [Phytophthora sojae]|eukprot:XP_009517047.1 hypothetical protein PHYSODRAFT_261138 [Phytophthora sojae]
MADPDTREHKRFRLSAPDAVTDSWDFLSPWFYQLEERLMVISGDYLEVLEPDSRRLSVAQTENEQPERYEDYDWRTREALELLVLVHSVNNQAWAKLLLEKCALRFENEEDYFDANNDDDDGPPINDTEAFTLECEHEREVPLSPRFQFRVLIGRQHTGKLSPVAKWKNFFLSHTSNYQPSPEFVDAKRRILAMQDEEFKKHPRVPRSIEIPVSLEVSMPRESNKDVWNACSEFLGLESRSGH